MRTISAKAETLQRRWYLVDGTDKVLGRLAAQIAHRLRGKHKPEYTPHVDCGDYIVVINADKVRVTGNKSRDKLYYRHSGYTGGLKTTSFDKMLASRPCDVLEIAVKGMLPKNPLGREIFRKLKVYAGAEHPHAAQQLQILDIEEA